MYGCILSPSFAIAWYAEHICIAVTATPCPIGARDHLTLSHFLQSGRIPYSSPGSSTPVFCPNPKRDMYVQSRSGPRSYPSLPTTMFDECTIASLTVIVGSHTCEPSPGSR